jgi:hypothetical protein
MLFLPILEAVIKCVHEQLIQNNAANNPQQSSTANFIAITSVAEPEPECLTVQV